MDGTHDDAEHLRTIINSMTEGAVLMSADGDILTCNASAERILGLTADQMVGRSTHDPRWQTIYEDGSPFPSDLHPVAVSLRTGESCSNVLIGVHKPDGSLTWVRVNSTPLFRPSETKPYAVTATFADVTQQRTLEAQFLQAQKLEAVGQLAGGIAHDFNNMLLVTFNRCDLLLYRLRPDDPNRRHIMEIQTAAKQCADLTQQLLAVARRQVMQPQVLDTGTLIRELLPLLQRMIGEHVSVRMLLDDHAWRIYVDPAKLRQVVMNLVINARDAMPGGGTLTVEVRNFVADPAYVLLHPHVPHGEYLTLTVSDTGTGIPEEVRNRIFDPFFTTKAVGKGSGLGLAVVRGIVEQTGGHISVYSEVGRGTTFKLFFPRYEGDVEQLLAAGNAARPRGTETILLVEDEYLVRTVLREGLEEHGYRVIDADCGAAALETAARTLQRIDLLITDVMMPGMTGSALATQLVEKHPHLRVICMSGYTDLTIADYAQIKSEFLFLEKPIMMDALLQQVREILDR